MSYPATTELSADVIESDGRTAVGCFVRGGKIIPALSPVKFATMGAPRPSKVKYCDTFMDAFVIFAAGGLCCVNKEGVYGALGFVVPAKKPFFVDTTGANGMETYFVSDSKSVRMRNDSLYILAFNGGVYGGVFKNGRVFGICADDAHKIAWSGPEGVFDWKSGISGAGWAYMPQEIGQIKDLAVYDDDIVVLGEYGVATFSAYGNPETFKQAYMGGKVENTDENTVAVAAGKLVFCSGGKAVAYDKNEITPLDYEYKDDFYDPVCASALDDWYFVSGKSKKLGRAVLLSLNVRSGESYYIDVDVSALCAYGVMYGFIGSAAYRFDRGAYTFVSGNVDFGTPRRKRLKSIHLGNSDDVEIEVTNGFKTRILRGVRGYCRVDMSGNNFKITVRGSGEIGGIRAVAEAIDAV